MICFTIQPIAFQNFPKVTWVLACGVAEVIQAQSGTVILTASAAGPHPPGHVHSFCPPRVLFMSVQPGRHLDPVLVGDCRQFFQSGASFFGFRGEVVAETSPWHIVSHCTHSSALFFSCLSGTFKCCYLIIYLKGVLL